MKLMTTLTAPLSSSAYLSAAIYAFQNSTSNLASSVARLSSGNRITKVGDDVAAFSVATRMQSQLSGLKQASVNAAQGNSMLQVAQGGLSQIQELLDSMKAIAVQANSSSLTTADRSYLQAQFNEYLDEIDRISSTTEFNNISLLNGDLSGENKMENSTDLGTQATGALTFSGNFSAGQTIKLNGVTFTAGSDFTIGGDLATSLANFKTVLNNSTNSAISKATYDVSGGNQLTITFDAAGSMGNQYIINQGGSTASFTTTGAATNNASIYTLSGGEDDGLSMNGVQSSGTIGDSLLNALSQVAASVTLYITGTISNNEQLRIDDGNGGLISFTFKTTASAATDIQIGSTIEETLQNAIETITEYSDANSSSDNYGLRQLEFKIDGNNLVITNKNIGNATDLTGAALDISTTLTHGSLSSSSFNTGSNAGINVSGITNGDWVGEIQGFSATYNSADNITLSLTVGGSTYTATISDTTPGSDTFIRFSSTNGGYFDVELDGTGLSVADQSDATTFANRLNAAFDGVSFYQERTMDNFDDSGDFIGASVKFQLDSFSDVRIDSINVTAPVGSGYDGTIDIVVNGETFRASSGIGGTLGAYEPLKFVSLDDPSKVITLFNGATAQDFSDATAAADFEENLRAAFGLDETGSGVDFQIGTDPTDVVNVVVGNVSADKLFNGVTPDVSTTDDAADAQDLIDTALDSVLETISRVGAYQSRFDSAANVIQNTIDGVTQAKSILTDTDIASESTVYAQETLKVNAAMAVIAQTRNLQAGLLQMLQFSGGN